MKPVEVTIDSQDDAVAVLDTPAGKVTMPRALLPAGAKEGDRLRLSLELDPQATARARQEIRDLQKKARNADDVTEI